MYQNKLNNNKFKSLIQTLQKKLNDANSELDINKKILIQNSKLAIMGEMIDAIAHQWVQPLNIISIKSDFLTIHVNNKGMLDKKHLEKSQASIKYQVEHLNSTLNEFRNFLRPNYHIKQLSLKNILDSISILLKDELISNSIQLDIKHNKDIFILINENDIKHIFINLINNAKDEMVQSGVEIDSRIITISYIINEKYIEILVKDNGGGIPKKLINNIFKPNFTTKEKKGGTGIGLYMCKQLIHKHNGQIGIYNDNGAVFKITFPKIK